MAEEKDFFGQIGDIFNGVFDTTENVLTRILNIEELRQLRGLAPANTPGLYDTIAPPPPSYATGTGTATGVGPFDGVSVEVMVMIVGAAMVALVLLRQ